MNLPVLNRVGPMRSMFLLLDMVVLIWVPVAMLLIQNHIHINISVLD